MSRSFEEIASAVLQESAEVHERLGANGAEAIARAATAIVDALRSGGKVLLFGNGGSAADAQHIAAELVGHFESERPPLSAIALTTDTSALTSIGNDRGFESIFARQLAGLARPSDIVVALSTSGRSANVLAGVREAHRLELVTVGLTGGDGGELEGLVDHAIVVPSSNTARIQEGHIAVGHVICGLVESTLSGD